MSEEAPVGPSVAEQAETAFASLPEDLQRRIRTDGDAIGERVSNHVVQILIGVPGGQAPPEDANHASGVAVLVGNRLYPFTAHHVLAAYRKRRAADRRVVFQAGNVSFDPEPRIKFESPRDDVVAIELNISDQRAIPVLTWIPPRWPPPDPEEGEFVAFAGLHEHRSPTPS